MLEKILSLVKRTIPQPVFRRLQPWYHFLLAFTGNIIYRFPGYKMTVIGVTGTNGKSTTVELICEMLKEAGEKVGMISTVSIEINGQRQHNATNRTTLGRWRTHRLMSRMAARGCKYAVIEVASEAICQYRIWGIPFDVAVFMNLSPEHLNFHKTMENYRNAKGQLFAKLKSHWNSKKTVKISVVNADDAEAAYFLSFPADKKITFGLEKGDVKAQNVNCTFTETQFEIIQGKNKMLVKTGALGQFNVYNELAAFCVGLGLGVEPEVIITSFAKFAGTIGRIEKIEEGQNFNVIIDYAVTPDAQEAIYSELRKFTSGRLISVFGATGDRDKQKRPGMGRVAAELTDIVVLTDDETYSEESRQIIKEVYGGVPKELRKKVAIMPDRYQAIKKAFAEAKDSDTVVITGIGHQKYRTMSGAKMTWDERSIVREILKMMMKKGMKKGG